MMMMFSSHNKIWFENEITKRKTKYKKKEEEEGKCV